MHGWEGDNRKRSQHMRSVPTRSTRTAAGVLVASPSGDSFYKDGRKISVGDCALFKPPQDSPPFIGIIRSIASSKENNLQLSVNWLYRPSEVKLSKGILPDASPNEIYYSFHKDKIPAASLLHPCKVAFLPKGGELPPGISSFVCWRVYDIASKRLWWLTDQDYINERQEEVDQLLHKTQAEMHATVQSGGRSPKPVNGPTSTSQLKPGSDNGQSSSNNFPSQAKGKKRERGEQGLEPVKRERSLKADDGDFNQVKVENILKSEIAKITERGGLVESEGVEKLVQLMQPDRIKMDLISRSMLAGVVAATDKFDCLNRFVQLRGLPVLDEWLQDFHKGKIGDAGSPKDGDKPVEDFLLVLLRALDKLPVNLQALQMCNIGRSVNHLRTHKNLEIQKKARVLVDTWKKRVEAEMNIIEAKSGSNQTVSWPSKSRIPEVSHGVSRHPSGSSEVVVKGSVVQLSQPKTALAKPVDGEAVLKAASSSPGRPKSVLSPVAVKENQPRISVSCASDLPATTVREDKNSSSTQSHNYGQTLSGKEDTRSSSAGSMSVSKISSGVSRHRKSITGLTGATVCEGQRETRSSRNSSLNRNSAPEKLLQSGLTCEKPVDVPILEGSGQKLIVKIPNRGRSPAQSASGGSFEDPSIINSRASSAMLSEKHDQLDRSLKEKSDGHRGNATPDVNMESWQSNDFKDVVTGPDEGDGSPAAIADDERSRIADDSKKLHDAVKATSSSPRNELKSDQLHETSFTPMNALIESCAKYSEVNASMSPGDNVGMNLLASVAAGEMSKSDLVSPTDSPQINISSVEDTSLGDDARLKPGDYFSQEQIQTNDNVNVDNEKQGVTAGSPLSRDGVHLAKVEPINTSGDRKTTLSSHEEIHAAEPVGGSDSCMDLQHTGNPCVGVAENSDEMRSSVSVAMCHAARTDNMVDEVSHLHDEKTIMKSINIDGILESKPKGSSSLTMEEKGNEATATTEDEKQAGDLATIALPESECKNKNDANEHFVNGIQAEQMSISATVKSDPVETANVEALHWTGSDHDIITENTSEFVVGKAQEQDSVSNISQSERHRINTDADDSSAPGCSSGGETNRGVMEEHSSGGPFREACAFSTLETDRHVVSKESKFRVIDANEKKMPEPMMAEASSCSAAGASDDDSKLKFDLNEGINTDDGKYGDPMNSTVSGSSSTLHAMNQRPFTGSSVSGNLPASITVAAAAKGPFVPPDDLLKSKGELGWKGSAATSAFRPAEPRKVVEMPQAVTNSFAPDSALSRQGRPLLDIDLNVPDEILLKDLTGRESDHGIGCGSEHVPTNSARNELLGSMPARSPGGLDLDLNQVDEANDMGQCLASTSSRLEAPLHIKSVALGRIPNGEVKRDFDLNDGPNFDDVGAEPSSVGLQSRNNMQSQPLSSGLRMNNPEIVNFASWFTPANAFPAVAIPSVLAERGEQPFSMAPPGAPQRILGPATGGTSFNPDIYRGSVLSSSPAIPFTSNPFQYPVFPFGTSFPLPSANFSGGSSTYMEPSSGGRLCFPAVHSQLLGPAGTVSSQYPRPCVINVPDGSNNGGVESTRKWARQGLDLNAGPGVLDMEGKDETAPLASRQLSVATSQALADEQTKIYQVASGIIKRKEPDGGWESEGFRYRQSSWQ